MNDDEIIETFLKENDAELSRLSFRRKLKSVISGMGMFLVAFSIASLVVLFILHCVEKRTAAQKVIDDEKAVADERARKIEDARLLEKRHRENQYAYIMVQYAADGHAVGCWVTQHKNDVVSLTDHTPSAYSYISNYKDYIHYGPVLRMDPSTCIVWHWPGQDR